METELLVIKSGGNYIRVKNEDYLLCGLDKASVFPVKKLEQVNEHVRQIEKDFHMIPKIFKLILREEPFGTPASNGELVTGSATESTGDVSWKNS